MSHTRCSPWTYFKDTLQTQGLYPQGSSPQDVVLLGSFLESLRFMKRLRREECPPVPPFPAKMWQGESQRDIFFAPRKGELGGILHHHAPTMCQMISGD